MKGEDPNLWLIWKREQIGEWFELFLQHNKQKFTNLCRRKCLIILLFLMQLVLNHICHIEHTGKTHMRWAHYIHSPMRKGSGICTPYQICPTRDLGHEPVHVWQETKVLSHHQCIGAHTPVWSVVNISARPCHPLHLSRGWILRLKPPPRRKRGTIMWEVTGSVSECGSRNSSTDFTQNRVKSEMVRLWTRSTKSETLGLGPRYRPGF